VNTAEAPSSRRLYLRLPVVDLPLALADLHRSLAPDDVVHLTVARDAPADTYSFQTTLTVADSEGRPGEVIKDENCPSIIIDLL
jgi:hypothetical protein